MFFLLGSVMSGLGTAQHWGAALWQMDGLRLNGLEPNTAAHDMALAACEQGRP